MSGELILVVEDEAEISQLIEFNLTQAGYSVSSAASGEEALEKVKHSQPDLIVLDLMLPGIDGMQVCRELFPYNIPILMLTAKSDNADIVLGLEMGADDYMTKPFSPRVLTARVKAVLRRKSRRSDAADRTMQPVVSHRGITVDSTRHSVKAHERVIDLSATEFSILAFLVQNPGWVFSRGQIISACKGTDYPVTERSVDVQILSIRKKLGESGSLIETVRGIGYRMAE